MAAEGLGWHYRVIGAVLGNLAKGLGSSGDGEILVGRLWLLRGLVP